MNIDKRALKGVIDEIEASRARQKGETEFQREALKKAVKQHNLDAKAIRIVLQRRAMGDTKRDEQDYFVHSYEVALGGKRAAMEALEQGASIREAAAAGGISTGAAGNLAKAVQKSSFVDADGVITETAESPPDESCGGGEMQTRNSTLATEGPWPVPEAKGADAHGAGVAPGPQEPTRDVPPAGGAASTVEMGHGTPDAGLGGATSPDPWDDVGPMPAGLRRAG